ncbi:hypothetical protein Cgig2_017498 [Carnegiea gigantea]|uniref:Uncharacterized protein n=1 Tax=Carnegiea gigantea TaxID=171969 RepID=A0A9Q1QCP2_9CARY|nr:hypothetical protein Cgig2_017498 [Carnegiea gigantea]
MVDLVGLYDFDVHSLCQPQTGEVDVFDSDLVENSGQANDEDRDHDDSEDSDFREWNSDGPEKFENFSLDEEDDLELENESLDGKVDVFDSDVEGNSRQADDEDSDHDDSEDKWQSNGSEESQNFSLDEVDDLEHKNESLDDINLETDTQLHMTLGYGSIDDDLGGSL